MNEEENDLVFSYPDHAKPVTRRDFLAQGLLAFSATTFLPSLYGMFANSAFADECDAPSAFQYIPFLVFDCAGGAALPANFLVGKSGGPEDLLASYDRLGWNPKESGAIDKSFGLPMAAKASKIFEGISRAASSDARKNLRMGSFCHFAQDDTNSNTLSAAALVAKAGYRGKALSRGLGTVNTVSGGNSQAVSQDPAMKPLFVGSVNDLNSAIGFGSGEPFGKFASEDLKAMMSAGADLSALQVKSFEASEKGKRLAQLVKCASKENLALFGGSLSVDPRSSAVFRSLYGLAANTAPTQRQAVVATVVMNLLSFTTGPGIITIGGCDYHNNTQTAGDAKDLEIGTEIGRAVEAAHRQKSPLFFQILTDGGVNNRAGTRVWVSDAGDRSMTVIGYYDPKGPAPMRKLQVGNYTDGQGVDRTTPIGNKPFKVGCAVFANYLKLIVKPSEFEKEFNKVVPRGTFKDSAELESMLIFG